MNDTPSSETERIVREHRKWTRWLQGRKIIARGNLVLTNRRLVFLHRIVDSPEVAASIKRLADAPIGRVLDYAFTLHRGNFQIPLSRVLRARGSLTAGLPFPRSCLSVFYLDEKKRTCRLTFSFEMPVLKLLTHPQLATDWAWATTINRTVRPKPGATHRH